MTSDQETLVNVQACKRSVSIRLVKLSSFFRCLLRTLTVQTPCAKARYDVGHASAGCGLCPPKQRAHSYTIQCGSLVFPARHIDKSLLVIPTAISGACFCCQTRENGLCLRLVVSVQYLRPPKIIHHGDGADQNRKGCYATTRVTRFTEC